MYSIDGRQRGQAEADGHGHADGAQHDEITEQRGQRFDVVTENDRRSDDENRYEADQGIHQPANLDLLVERLEQAETHEPEAERQDQIRDEEGDAQGRGMLRVFLQPFDLAPAVVGDGGRQDEEQHLDHDPADLLQARGQMIVEHGHPDGRTLFDGDAQGEVGKALQSIRRHRRAQ